MKLFKRTLTTAAAVCLALQSAVVCFGAEAEEQIPAGGEEVGLYTSENDEAIQLTEDIYNSWYEGDQTYDGTEKTLYGYSLMDSNNYYRLTEDEDYVVTYENNSMAGCTGRLHGVVREAVPIKETTGCIIVQMKHPAVFNLIF